LADICGYKLPTNLQNFTQKNLTEVKIFQKVLGDTFFETPCTLYNELDSQNYIIGHNTISSLTTCTM